MLTERDIFYMMNVKFKELYYYKIKNFLKFQQSLIFLPFSSRDS